MSAETYRRLRAGLLTTELEALACYLDGFNAR
jgi:hypothetical protein